MDLGAMGHEVASSKDDLADRILKGMKEMQSQMPALRAVMMKDQKDARP